MHIYEKTYRISGYDIFFWTYVVVFLFFWIHTPKPKPPKLTPYQVEHITKIQTGNITPVELVNFACTLAGTPYKYGSANPSNGLDCSGYMTYVFNHFGIMVPRVSTDFAQIQHEVPIQDAKLGDLILFTGTDSTDRTVGHMGIVSSSPGEPLRFMHSTSGKEDGVVETDFYTRYYTSRFVKVIRVFPQNDPKHDTVK
jgi:cell wall-associated NlpC family hydrolase